MDLQLLGPIEATVDGRPIALGATKQRAVLAMLALHAEPHGVGRPARSRACGASSAPTSAAKMVQLYVSQLRKAAGRQRRGDRDPRPRLRAAAPADRGGRRALRAPERRRVARARRSRCGAATPLADVAGEPFAAAEIRRLEELRLRATERAIDADLAAGRHARGARRARGAGRGASAARAAARAADAGAVPLGPPGRRAGGLPRRARRARRADRCRARSRASPPPRRHAGRRTRRSSLPATASPRFVSRGDRRGARSRSSARSSWSAGWRRSPSPARTESPGLPGIAENAVGVIEPDSGEITTQFTVGRGPNAIAAGGGLGVGRERARRHGLADRPRPRPGRASPSASTRSTLTFAARRAVGPRPRGRHASRGSTRRRTGSSRRSRSAIRPAASPPGSARCGWCPRSIASSRASISGAAGARTDIDLGANPTAVAAGSGAVWVASEEAGIVFRVDPGTRAVTASIGVGRGPVGVAVGEGAVWVANRQDATVSRIDPATDTVTAIVPVGREPGAIAAGAGGVWVASASEGAVTRIDPADAAARASRSRSRAARARSRSRTGRCGPPRSPHPRATAAAPCGSRRLPSCTTVWRPASTTSTSGRRPPWSTTA